MVSGFEYAFPAIRGVQAKREYYVSMCPLRLLSKLFLFNEEEIVPELRAQRQLNRNRVPEIVRYVSDNPEDYVFSAITASVDGDVIFEPVGDQGEANRIGVLKIPMSARFIINDGQHRRAAIEQALKERPELADETIAVVFFIDQGLERCQQMFADLNRHAVRPSKSLGVLYDYRDEAAAMTKALVAKSPIFRDVVELERTTLSPRSRRLFTLSAIYGATNDFLAGLEEQDSQKLAEMAIAYWEEVAKHMKEWNLVRAGSLTAGEVRADFIHSHGVVLQALARAGNTLIKQHPKDWKRRLKPLADIDWRRANSRQWEGRALIGGRVSKAQQNVTLTTNAIKTALGLELTPDEERVETAYQRGEFQEAS